MNKRIRVKFFENPNLDKLESQINRFIQEQEIIDIKIHVDPQVNPEWDVYPCYFAMVIYT